MADISTETKDDTNAPAPGDGDGAAPPPAPDGPATPPRDEPAPAEEAKPEGAPPRPEPQPNGAEAQTNGAEAGPDEAGEEEINIGLPQVKGAISLPPDRPLANAEPILLNDRFDIHPAKPLHDLDPPSARAFEAADRLEPTRAIFALVCIPGMPIRTDVIKQIVGEEIPGTLDLLDEGAVDWPLLGQRCQILVLQRPLGGRAGVITTMELSSHRKADIIRLIVEGVAGGLQQLSFRSIAHGAIRHDNVFFLDADRQSVVLGEFVSVPSGFDQPTVFETIERGMANRAGRGEASKMDDFYSLGVMLVFLILGRNPTGNLDDHQLIATKIAQTSFMALAGKTQISVTYLDALRGLLNDDQEERWDFEELEHWISGQRLSTLSSKAISKAPRPLKFGGEEHYFSRTLAHAMNMKPDGALKLIRDHTLDQWLERGLEEKEMAHAVEQSIVEIDAFQSDKTIANDILLARVLMLMDPGAPIRYKSLSFFPKGLGPWLAVELLRKGDTKIFVEAINRNIADNWFTLQNQGLPGHMTDDKSFSGIKDYLRNAAPGFGLERCLYELNKGVPCASPTIAVDLVDDLELLLPALENAEKRVDTKKSPIDRHIAAFIVAHHKDRERDILSERRLKAQTAVIERNLAEIADTNEAVSILGSLRLLAILQNKYKIESLYGVAKWIGGLIGPAVTLYKSRLTRQVIESEMPRLVRRGSLTAILDLLDNAEKKAVDAHEHMQAIEEFQDAEMEINEIEQEMASGSRAADEKGKKATAITAVMLSLFIVALMLI